MRPSEFEKYLANPLLLEPSSIPDLQKLVEEFPYFQAAHVLLTLAGKQHDALVYQRSLKKTAIVTSSRAKLFQLVEEIDLQGQEVSPVSVPEEPISSPVPNQELNILKAAELSSEFSEAKNAEPLIPEILPATEAEVQEEAIPISEPEPIQHELPVAKEEKTQELKFEEEISKQVVTAFVEKELLKTPEWNKPEVKPEPESFGDWLSFLKKNNGQSYSEISGQVDRARAKKEREKENDYLAGLEKVGDRKQKNKAIIDKIIETNPGLIRNKEEPKFFAPDLKAKESLLENEHLVTETLARIYAMQGSVNKAVRAYEILSLKYPQKSAYFASLIQKLKNNQ
jgi:hypothetical protein